jgi:hypothetical protein
MTEPTRFVRRNRVDEAKASLIGVVGGVVASAAGAHPTGAAAVDVVMVALAAGMVTWASASAPWWAVTAAAGIGAAVAVDPLVAVVGGVGFGIGLWVGLRRRDLPEVRAVIGAIAVNALIRSDIDGLFGLSAIVAIIVCMSLFVAGVARRPSAVRRPAFIVAGVTAVWAVLALIAGAVSVFAARSDVTAGNRHAREALSLLNDGQYAAAADLFEQSSVAFGAADDRLGGPIAAPAMLVPIVAQNLAAGADLAAAASMAMSEAAVGVRAVDPSSLRLVDGAIDLDAIRAVEAPLTSVQDALLSLRATTEEVQSPWLLGRVQEEIAELEAGFDENETRLQNAIDAVRVAPAMLGGEGERRYLVLFSTPAEARGVGGFVGNYAEVLVENGRLSVPAFGRTSELSEASRGGSCDGCPAEMLQRYARFGLNTGEGGAIGPVPWSNITMPAHYPYIAETAEVLYREGTGVDVDGVILMDPYVIEALMSYTGPVEVPELGVTVEPDGAADFILRDQYILGEDKDLRVEALDTLGTAVIDKLLTSELPNPADLAREFGPLVGERRMLLWTNDPDERDLLARTGLLGGLPELDPANGGFAVTVNNRSGNKIDVFLERDITTEIVENTDGTRNLVADVTLTNTAPADGLPDYVIGNAVGLRRGTSRLFVSFYGPPTVESVTLAGAPIAVEALPEAGWTALATLIELGPGESGTYRLVYDLPPADPNADPGEASEAAPPAPVTWEQPLVRDR